MWTELSSWRKQLAAGLTDTRDAPKTHPCVFPSEAKAGKTYSSGVFRLSLSLSLSRRMTVASTAAGPQPELGNASVWTRHWLGEPIVQVGLRGHR